MSRPASPLAATLAQAAMELRLTARRGENILVTVVLPVVVLLFFASVSVLRTGGGSPVDFLLPGSMALAVIATSLVNLGIATAYERQYWNPPWRGTRLIRRHDWRVHANFAPPCPPECFARPISMPTSERAAHDRGRHQCARLFVPAGRPHCRCRGLAHARPALVRAIALAH